VAGAAASLVIAATGVVAYVQAVRGEEQKTRKALAQEQQSRSLAEERAREVQQAQARIDGLLRDLEDSPTKSQIVELQRTIRGELPASTTARRSAQRRAPESTLAPTPPATSSIPPQAEAARLKVQTNW